MGELEQNILQELVDIVSKVRESQKRHRTELKQLAFAIKETDSRPPTNVDEVKALQTQIEEVKAQVNAPDLKMTPELEEKIKEIASAVSIGGRMNFVTTHMHGNFTGSQMRQLKAAAAQWEKDRKKLEAISDPATSIPRPRGRTRRVGGGGVKIPAIQPQLPAVQPQTPTELPTRSVLLANLDQQRGVQQSKYISDYEAKQAAKNTAEYKNGQRNRRTLSNAQIDLMLDRKMNASERSKTLSNRCSNALTLSNLRAELIQIENDIQGKDDKEEIADLKLRSCLIELQILDCERNEEVEAAKAAKKPVPSRQGYTTKLKFLQSNRTKFTQEKEEYAMLKVQLSDEKTRLEMAKLAADTYNIDTAEKKVLQLTQQTQTGSVKKQTGVMSRRKQQLEQQRKRNEEQAAALQLKAQQERSMARASIPTKIVI
jgi:hypothetical protein